MMVSDYADNVTGYGAPSMVEGIARVVAIEGNMILLEPEQSGGCSSCASSGSCGTRDMNKPSGKIEKRRFRINNTDDLRVGERIVIGIRNDSLIKASITAYIIPLAVMLLAGVLAQWKFASDYATFGAMVAGLMAGLAVARRLAERLQAHGDLVPQYLRRARPGETCHT